MFIQEATVAYHNSGMFSSESQTGNDWHDWVPSGLTASSWQISAEKFSADSQGPSEISTAK